MEAIKTCWVCAKEAFTHEALTQEFALRKRGPAEFKSCCKDCDELDEVEKNAAYNKRWQATEAVKAKRAARDRKRYLEIKKPASEAAKARKQGE